MHPNQPRVRRVELIEPRRGLVDLYQRQKSVGVVWLLCQMSSKRSLCRQRICAVQKSQRGAHGRGRGERHLGFDLRVDVLFFDLERSEYRGKGRAVYEPGYVYGVPHAGIHPGPLLDLPAQDLRDEEGYEVNIAGNHERYGLL